MSFLLKLSRLIDTVSNWIGRLVMWLVLAAVLISAGNAIMRKAFNIGSNAYLEIQWYLFAAVFMLGAAYVFLHNGHVRIDFIAGKLSKRTNALIDAIGIVVFLIPLCLILIDLSWPFFMRTYLSGEMSENAGGLIRWPVVLMIPVGLRLPAAAGAVRTDQARGLPDRQAGRTLQLREREVVRGDPARRNGSPGRQGRSLVIALIADNFVPLMFCGLLFFLLTGIPVAFGLAATGLLFGFIGMEIGLFPENLFGALPLRVFGIMKNDTLLAIPFFTFMGIILERSGMAEDAARNRGAGVRPVARRAGRCGDPGRCAAGRDHRRRRRGGDLDGPDLAAHHAALRLQPHHRDRHHHRIGHAGAGDPAVAGADRAGRPAGPLGRRHVRRRTDPGPDAGRQLPRLRPARVLVQAEVDAAAAARGAHLPRVQRRQRPRLAAGAAGHLRRCRLGLVAGPRERHEPVAGAHHAGAGRRDLHHVDDGGVVPGARRCRA